MVRLLALPTAMAGCLIACAVMGVAKDPAPPHPPGKLIDLGGRKLHFQRAGSGSPTVVIENGNSAFSIDWALVQPEVAKFAQVCTYDRAGYAWSDPGPADGTVEQTADDLHLLLLKAGVKPPYVLVGASIGGFYVRAYQRRYPDEVVGLVFVDSTHEDGLGYMVEGKPKAIHLLSRAEMRAAFQPLLGDPSLLPKAPAALEASFNRLPKDLQAARLWALQKWFTDLDATREMISADSWRLEFIAQHRARLATAHPLGDLPLVVMGRTNDHAEKRKRQQEELRVLSSVGKLVLAENIGHEIHLDRPDFVVQAIREVVDTVQKKVRPKD